MYNKYRVLQLTNNTIGPVAVTNFMPLGNITRRVTRCEACVNTFTAANTNNNTVIINECGNYNITYNASLIGAAAGVVIATLVFNGVNVYSTSATVDAGGTVNLTIPYQVRVLPNSDSIPTNNPASVQIQLNGIGITGGTSVLKIERVY